MVLEKFTDNDGVKIRYLDNDPSHPVGLPILFATGIVDFADDYVETLEFFADRRVLVADLRGRGGSDAPPTGYSVLEQAGDLRSVLEVNGIGPFHLMTFSRGTTPGLELAFQLSDRVRTVSIGDYLPAEIALPPSSPNRCGRLGGGVVRTRHGCTAMYWQAFKPHHGLASSGASWQPSSCRCWSLGDPRAGSSMTNGQPRTAIRCPARRSSPFPGPPTICFGRPGPPTRVRCSSSSPAGVPAADAGRRLAAGLVPGRRRGCGAPPPRWR